MLDRIFRFVDLVLITLIIGAAITYLLFELKPKTFGTKDVLALFFGAFLIFGLLWGTYDWGTFQYEMESKAIPTSGVLLAGELSFSVSWDVTGTSPATEVQWGTLEPDDTGSVTLWVKNEAPVPVYAKLEWNEASWQPAGGDQYFDLSWDFGQNPLGSNRVRKVVLQLHVHEDITGITDFSFDIVITVDDQPFTG